jgi:hypothetical protein
MRRLIRHNVVCLAATAFAVTGGSPKLWAQFTSSIEGTVVDPSGARVPKANVVIANAATGVKTTTATNSVGYFLFPSLPAGTFQLTLSLPGFKTYEIPNLGLEVDQRRTLNVTMQLGTEATTVSVQAEAATVDLSEVRLAGNLETRQLIELPSGGQSFMTLVTLQAGMTGGGGSDTFNAELRHSPRLTHPYSPKVTQAI